MLGYALARARWGRGLATEATMAAVRWVVVEHDLGEIWAATAVANVRSQRVLEKLGMTRAPADGAEPRYRLIIPR